MLGLIQAMSGLKRQFSQGCRFLFFSHTSPLMVLSRKRTIGEADMPALDSNLEMAKLTRDAERVRTDTVKGMLADLIKVNRKTYLLMLALIMVILVAQLLVSQILHEILVAIELVLSGNGFSWTGMIFVALLAISQMSISITVQHYIYQAVFNFQRVVGLLNTKIYQKSLRLSRGSLQKRPVGDLVNYLGTDSDSIGEYFWCRVEIFYALAALIGVSALLFHYLGVAAFSGVLLIILLSPISIQIAKRFVRNCDQIMKHRDERVSQISQIFSAIRLIKFFAWENPSSEGLQKIRKKEVEAHMRLARTASLSMVFFVAVQALVAAVSFITYTLLGNSLDAPTIFASLALFGILQNPFGRLSDHVYGLTNGRVAAKRLVRFFQMEEQQLKDKELSPAGEALGVKISGLQARYHDDSVPCTEIPVLEIGSGESVAIVGPVGAGKSSFLLALLGELTIEQGSIEFVGLKPHLEPRLAWVPQTAFIMNASLAENICLGESDEQLEEAVEVCALTQDLRTWQGGLRTEIGENGINLSGGQKQRVALARAFVHNPGLVLLDDPLSAVDPNTEQVLAERLIFGAWSKLTRLVVTHRLDNLYRFDRILYMEQGKIQAMGNLAELLASCQAFKAFYQSHLASQEQLGGSGLIAQKAAQPGVSAPQVSQAEAIGIIDDEDRELGAVKWSVYGDYFRAVIGKRRGWLRGLALISLAVAAALIPMLQAAWLSFWSDQEAARLAENADSAGSSGFLWIYAGLGIVLLVVSYVRFRYWFTRSVKAGRNLHHEAFQAVLHTKIRFFDANPVGRILNRFSKDVDAVEGEMIWYFSDTVQSACNALVSFLVMAIIVPFALLFQLPMLLIYHHLQKSYRAVARETKRMQSLARSPRFAQYKETVVGLLLIRAFHKQNLFWGVFQKNLNHYQRMFYGAVLCNRWFSLRLPVVSSLSTFGVGVGLILLSSRGLISPGFAGLALLYSRYFAGYMDDFIRSFSEAEVRLTAVERLANYAKLEAEEKPESLVVPIKPEIWRGEIRFDNISVRYAKHLPLILAKFNLSIPAGARVGIIGRTGSGKSTLLQVLLRLIELEKGQIQIDGVDISKLPLSELRQMIAMIPQDPTLFAGSLRSNLDRFERYSDTSIWQSLRRVGMDEFVRSMPKGLETELYDGGQNLSQGQRQLLCLARALLLKAPIIALDEATASVDVVTDRKVQRILREECKGITTLMIAHRIETLVDCDLVVELVNGQVQRIIRQDTRPAVGFENLVPVLT